MAGAFFTILTYFLCLKLKSRNSREISIIIFLLTILIIGISRLILNVHWFSDVLAGWSLGVFVATASILLVRFINSALSIWINPGFHDSNLVLELHNISKHHSLLLKPGIKVGQVMFLRSLPVSDYDTIERYSYQKGVVAGRPSTPTTTTATGLS
jgi:hypothetical protein